MKVIDFQQIKNLNISPSIVYDLVNTIFIKKYECILPHKISIKLQNNIFVNTMPTVIPFINRYGVKIVSRFPLRQPALESDLLLYAMDNGKLLAHMDSSWITAIRTGAVASLAIQTLKKQNSKVYSFIGLGNTARATLLVLLSQLNEEKVIVRVLKYKNQSLDFINRFRMYNNVEFEEYEDIDELIKGSDVVVSCVTYADTQMANDSSFDTGVLVVPVHTRGFQNCDLFFDKVVVDDIDHVRDFKNFSVFKYLTELSAVLLKQSEGRVNDEERIIAYNIGLAINDIYIASYLYDIFQKEDNVEYCLEQPIDKFWV